MKLAFWKSLPLCVLSVGSSAFAESEKNMKVGAGIRAGYYMHMSDDKFKENGKEIKNNEELDLKDFHLDAAYISFEGDFTSKMTYNLRLGLGKSTLSKTNNSPEVAVDYAKVGYKIMDQLTLEVGYDQMLVGGLENNAGSLKAYHPTEIMSKYLPGASAMARVKFNVDEHCFVAVEAGNKNSALLSDLVSANKANLSEEKQNQQMPMFGVAWFGEHDLGAVNLKSNFSVHASLAKEQKDSANGIADLKKYNELYYAASFDLAFLDKTLDLKPAFLMNSVSYQLNADTKEVKSFVYSASIEAGYLAMNMVRPFAKYERSSLSLGYVETDVKIAKIADINGLSFGVEFYPSESKDANIHFVYNNRSVTFGEKGTSYSYKHINGQKTDDAKNKKTSNGEVILGISARI